MPNTRIIAISSALFVSLLVFAPFQASLQRTDGRRTPSQSNDQKGDVFSTNSRGGGGNTTKTTGTQGLNHGRGGNKTCQTTRNTPDYDPRTCIAAKPDCVLSSDPQRVFAEIDDFWRKQFAARGLPYKSPRLFIDTEFDEFPVVQSLYYSKKMAIFVNPIDLRRYSQVDGNVLALWLGHEFGHHVQQQLPYPAEHILQELQSDELAGVFLRYLHDKGCTLSAAGKEDDLARLEKHFRAIGDPAGTSPGDAHAHGNPAERWFYFRNGYRNGESVLRRLMPVAPPRRPASVGRPD